jgi:hypothetical protein
MLWIFTLLSKGYSTNSHMTFFQVMLKMVTVMLKDYATDCHITMAVINCKQFWEEREAWRQSLS